MIYIIKVVLELILRINLYNLVIPIYIIKSTISSQILCIYHRKSKKPKQIFYVLVNVEKPDKFLKIKIENV